MVREGDPASAQNYLPVQGRLKAVGERVQVYVDARDVETVTSDVVRDVVATFDTRVFPTSARLWGTARDADGDGRFTVLITGWLARLGGGRLAVDGFFRGADLDPALKPPFGNGCDMIYLNAGLPPGPRLQTVLAHEYAHAVTFSRKTLGGAGRGPEEEGWLDEAIAHLVEDWHGFSRSNLDDRVEAFLAQPERYRLVVEDYYAANLFRSQGHRGSTYLFLRWCGTIWGVDALLSNLIGSKLAGIANLEAATGQPFEDLFRQWSVRLFLDGLQPDGSGPPSGPRFRYLSPGGTFEDHWDAAGTSCHYLVIGRRDTGSAVRVEVAAPPEAGLQVTAIPLPAHLARIDLGVRSLPDVDGTRQVRLLARECEGEPVEFEELSWIPAGTEPPGRLSRDELARAFGSVQLRAQESRLSAPIVLTGVAAESGPTVLKLLARDGRGHQITSWAEIEPSQAAPED